MNREERQALLRSDRMVKLESLTQWEKYHIQHLIPSDADDDDDETVIVELETSEGENLCTSWPICPFEPRVNIVVHIERDTNNSGIYIYIYIYIYIRI